MKVLNLTYWWGKPFNERELIEIELLPSKSFHIEAGLCQGPCQLISNPNVVMFPRESHVSCIDVYDTTTAVFIHPNN